MPIFGDFGERTPEEIEQLQKAGASLHSVGQTIALLGHLIHQRPEELGADADDLERRDYYVLHDPRYEAAVSGEYEAMIVAIDAVAKYRLAQTVTFDTRRLLEHEASRMLIDANKLAGDGDITIADIAP